jgi:NADH-quinone oxidoreductase subunit L
MELALHNAWLIPLFPFVGFGIIILTGKRNLGVKAAVIALTMLGCSAVLSVLCALATFGAYHHNPEHFQPYVRNMIWGRLAQWPLEIGYQIDTLTCVMLLVVTLIGWLIHLYSVGYMEKDPRFTRFFAYLQLFCCAMLMLVLANNYLVLYAGWEGVGLCSYLLIGFWFEKPSAAKAAKKAFLVTRTGDCGLALGIFLLFAKTGTILYEPIFKAAQDAAHNHGYQMPISWSTLVALFHDPSLIASPSTDHFVFTLAALLIFFGAVGKSAQFPLHVWLPDAMEGPTPVSALIHAATMVAAGVYLVARSYPLFDTGGHEVGVALQVVAWIGAITAFMAATIAVAQNDIKRVLAYSTISQLGFMMLGLGCLGFTAGVFHLMTHAVFKALLFLGSGSVIHGMEHGHHGAHDAPGDHHGGAEGAEHFDPQDMMQMGGLAKYMPVTCWTYWAGMLALSGIPPLAGFWSKDEILADAFAHNKGVWLLGAAAAFLTAFYMGRQMFLVFHGDLRTKDCHPHESPWTMVWPLRILAVGAILIGLLGTPWANVFHHYVSYGHGHALPPNYFVMLLSIVIAAAGILLARHLYGVKPLQAGEPDPLIAKLGPLWTFLQNKWYFDELYDFLVIQPLLRLTRACYRFDQKAVDGTVNFVGIFSIVLSRISGFLDKWVVDGIVNLIGIVTRASGNLLKLTQNGLAQTYMLVVFAGAMVVVVIRMMGG